MEYLRSEMGKASVLEGQAEIVGKYDLFNQLQQLTNKCDMAASGMFSKKSGAEVTAMKEALNAQQQLLCQLYADLDKEREASETAASEALSMIMRLQVEKAAIEMEAKQYKRMAEEKMFHANECLAICEDVIYQTDVKIAALQCQIQAYKYKILNLGCYYTDCCETKHLEFILPRKIESVCGEGNSCGEEANMNIILPMGCPVDEKEKARANSIAWTVEESKSIADDQELKVGSPDTLDVGNSFWQQIKKLDEMVKGISNTTEFGRNNRCNSTGALCSRRSLNALNSCRDAVKKQPVILQETKTTDDSMCSTCVQDIFEVPEVPVSDRGVAGKRKLEPEEENTGAEIKRLEPDSPTVIKSLFKQESKARFENKLFEPSGRKNLDRYNFACVQSAIGNAEPRSEIEKLSKRVKRLEQATNVPNTRPENTVVGEEEFGSLRDLLSKIQTQLSTIQTEIKSLEAPKSKKT